LHTCDRAGLRAAAVRPHDFGALKRDVTLDNATDMPWLPFGYASIFTLTEDNGCSPERVEAWLRDTACAPPAEAPAPAEARPHPALT
jgi:hypothetical protein